MKRGFSLLLVLIMIFTLGACGDSESHEGQAKTPSASSAQKGRYPISLDMSKDLDFCYFSYFFFRFYQKSPQFLSLKFAPKLMLGCIVSNCGTQAILRVQIDTNISWVLSFLHLRKIPENQHISKRQMHPCMGGYRFLSWNCRTFDISYCEI